MIMLFNTINLTRGSKENIVLRAAVSPYDVYVVPNSVDTALFRPNPAARTNEAGAFSYFAESC